MEERSKWKQARFALKPVLSLQVDYTDAGTCNKCLEMRKNVSNLAKSCTCTVRLEITKAFKVKKLHH